MAPRKKHAVHISGQSLRYLEELVRLHKIIETGDVTFQYFTARAIRFYFLNLARSIRNKDLAHMLDDQLVRNVEIAFKLRPPEPPQTGKE